jgi:hypothetical protein
MRTQKSRKASANGSLARPRASSRDPKPKPETEEPRDLQGSRIWREPDSNRDTTIFSRWRWDFDCRICRDLVKAALRGCGWFPGVSGGFGPDRSLRAKPRRPAARAPSVRRTPGLGADSAPLSHCPEERERADVFTGLFLLVPSERLRGPMEAPPLRAKRKRHARYRREQLSLPMDVDGNKAAR